MREEKFLLDVMSECRCLCIYKMQAEQNQIRQR